MATSIFLVICLLRVALIWQMVELLKNIKTPYNNAIATVGFLIYIAYLFITTFLGSPVNAESVLRIVGQILIFVGANRCFTSKEKV